MSISRDYAWALPAALLLLSACATAPRPGEYRRAVTPGPGVEQSRSSWVDGRARFRRTFCELARPAGAADPEDPGCDRLLWRMQDEPPPIGDPAGAEPGQPARLLRFVLVTGAFDDCYGEDGLPFRDAARDLAAQGYRVDTVRLSGRSSAEANADALANAVRPMLADEDDRLVLIGYSKGAVDILQLLAAHPDLVPRIAAVVSVAGPVLGTPLAGAGELLYDALLSRAFAGRCSPGDGGVIRSLLPQVREAWFEANPLPREVRFYSVVALPEWPVMARVLKPSWRMLAREGRLNDGQVRVQDAIIPGATLLGYVNADHWGIALRIERVLPHVAARAAPRAYPQRELLEAIFQTVSRAP